MLKISKERSVNISLGLSCLFFIIIIAGAVVMPTLSEMLIGAKDSIGNRDLITEAGKIYVLVLAYLALADLFLINSLLLNLLLRVKKHLVFTEKSISLIRGISWAAIFFALIFVGLGVYFQLAFIVAFAVLFLALSIRVVKNVIEEATAIKAENDLTV